MSNQRKRRFIRALAEYLSSDLARKSIELQMGKPAAREWAKLRQASPVGGWSDVDESENELLEFFGLEPSAPQTDREERG